MTGTASGITRLGSAVGMAAGGILCDRLGFSPLFYFAGALSIVASPIAARRAFGDLPLVSRTAAKKLEQLRPSPKDGASLRWYASITFTGLPNVPHCSRAACNANHTGGIIGPIAVLAPSMLKHRSGWLSWFPPRVQVRALPRSMAALRTGVRGNPTVAWLGRHLLSHRPPFPPPSSIGTGLSHNQLRPSACR